MAEQVDIFDRNKQRTGVTIDREKAFLHEGEYLMFVLALIETPEHRFLITRRAMDKKWAAGWWEIPGGGAQSGESSIQAVQREIFEETGLSVPEEKCRRIYSYFNEDLERGDNYFVDIYHIVLPIEEKALKLPEREIIEFRLAALSEMEALDREAHFLHYKRIMEALKAASCTEKESQEC